jgi:hypothetical protein
MWGRSEEDRTVGTGIFWMDHDIAGAAAGAEELRADELIEEGKARSRRSGGGKLSRSETVTVRLDPKLNYLCELAARAQRRTKSSFIEWAIDNALKYTVIPGTTGKSIADEAESLWDVEEADRLAQLALYEPILMTHEEQVIWKLVESNGLMWRGSFSKGKWCWGVGQSYFRWGEFREHFHTFVAVAEGRLPRTALPKWREVDEEDLPPTATRRTPAAFDGDLDEEIPF